MLSPSFSQFSNQSISVILHVVEVHKSAEFDAGCFQGGLSLGDDLNGFARDERGKPAQKHLQTVNTIEYVYQFGFRLLCQSSGCYLAFRWLGFDLLFVMRYSPSLRLLPLSTSVITTFMSVTSSPGAIPLQLQHESCAARSQHNAFPLRSVWAAALNLIITTPSAELRQGFFESLKFILSDSRNTPSGGLPRRAKSIVPQFPR